MASSSKPIDPSFVPQLFSEPVSSKIFTDYIASISSTSTLIPEIKGYSDATYHNHHSLGLSLCYLPSSSSSERILAYIDIYNPPTAPFTVRKRQKDPWDGYSLPSLPILFRFPSTTLQIPGQKPSEPHTTINRPEVLEVRTNTTGRDFVSCLGEPDKKGGGQNIAIPPFLEWNRVEILNAEGKPVELGILVELRDPGAQEKLTPEQLKKGAGGLWDRAAGWTWVGLKLFKAGSNPL